MTRRTWGLAVAGALVLVLALGTIVFLVVDRGDQGREMITEKAVNSEKDAKKATAAVDRTSRRVSRSQRKLDETITVLAKNGVDGLPGGDGGRGPAGGSGPAGGAGPAGGTGPSGGLGPAGPAGPDGLDGRDGREGTSGSNGVSGTNGTQGAQGERGARGRDGPTGPQGSAGAAGPTGEAGPVGLAPTTVICDPPDPLSGKQTCTVP